MKKIILCLLLLFLLTPLFCLADFDVQKWKFFKNIAPVAGDLARITIDDEIFTQAKKDLSDLRIIGDAGRETPFKIVAGRFEQSRSNYPVKIINSSYQSGRFSWAILDLGERGKIVNNLTLGTSTENFQRNVSVYGSDKIGQWNTISANGYIYDYTDRKGNLKTQNTRISFPDSIFRYYKVEISDAENKPVKIESALASQTISRPEKEQTRQPKFSVTQNKELRATEITADLGQSGMPTSKITFQVSDKNFNRALTIHSGNDPSNLSSRGQGYIFRYNTPKFSGENLAVSYAESNDRYLKIRIFNQDNSPLDISGLFIHSIYREIIFPAAAGQSYRIFYGNEKAYYPEYDLEKYFQYLDVEKAVETEISSQNNNPQYQPEKAPEKPLTEKIPYLMTGAIITISSILLILIYKFMKKQ